jgi:hypothetical protein
MTGSDCEEKLLQERSHFLNDGVWRGWNAPNPVIGLGQRSNLVPAVVAHAVASKTPFAL